VASGRDVQRAHEADALDAQPVPRSARTAARICSASFVRKQPFRLTTREVVLEFHGILEAYALRAFADASSTVHARSFTN
jgi:hypothetical protein